MTDATFAEILALFSRAYGTTYDGETKRVWRLLLDTLPDVHAREAAVHLCRSSPYPPKPADLFRIVLGTEGDVERRLDEEAELALAHLEAHLCDYRICDFGPVLNAVMRAMGGIDGITARMASGGWPYDRARVRTLYRAYRRRRISGEEGAPVIPLVMAESLARYPLASYQERGLSLPIITAHFMPAEDLRALPKGETDAPSPTAPAA